MMRPAFIATLRRASVAAPLVVALSACGGRTDAPVTPKEPSSSDVTFTIDLRTPNADDGAVLFDIVGPSVLDVTTRPGLEIDHDRVTANGTTTTTVAIRGTLASGAIADFRVPRADRQATYTIRLRQAAAGASGGYADRIDLNAYQLTIRR